VPWSDVTVEVVGVSSTSSSVEDMVGGFFTAANVTADELSCRRKLANDFAAVTDLLAYDGVPAVQWMLETTRQDCIEPRDSVRARACGQVIGCAAVSIINTCSMHA
jgi:hypothetical protein